MVWDSIKTADALPADCPPRPVFDCCEDEAARQWLRRGRWLVENKRRTTGLVDLLYAAGAYNRLQRSIVARTGSCTGGCNPDSLELDARGRLVCFRTRRPCPAHNLNLILERWSMSTEISTQKPGQLMPAAQQAQLIAIEELRTATSTEIAAAETAGHDVLKGMILAKAMQRLRELLSPELMQDVMALQNSPLGFMTDRGPENKNPAMQQPYGVEVVRDCTIVALLQGFRITGNEFNIISGRFYPAQAGCMKRVQEWPGLSNLQSEFGVPQLAGDKGALVPCSLRWTLGGREYAVICKAPSAEGETDTRIPVRVNSGMGADAIIGKAKRKLYARALDRLTGISQDDNGDIVAPATDAPRLEQTGQLADLVHEVLDTLDSDLAACDSVTDCVKRARAASHAIEGLAQRGLPTAAVDAAQRVIIDRRSDRAEAIRSTRGEGSNAE